MYKKVLALVGVIPVITGCLCVSDAIMEYYCKHVMDKVFR